jgi:cytochrome c
MSSTKKVWDSPKRVHWVLGGESDLDIPDGDAGRGERIFAANCAGCHYLDTNNWLGPNLRYIFNRPAVNNRKFNYSDNCGKIRGRYWTRSLLFVFLGDPESLIPETAMLFEGLKDPYDRACVIEYLHSLRVTSVKS